MPPQTPLLRPGRFFAQTEPNALRLLVVAIVLLLSLPAAIWGLGWVLSTHIDGTVLVDNPARPPPSFCENAPASMAEGCDAPAQIERNIDRVLQEALGRFIGPAMLGVPIALVVVGGILHAGAWMVGGDPRVGQSGYVALWGLVPTVFALPVAIGAMAVLLEPMTVSPATEPSALAAQLRGTLEPIIRIGPVLAGLTTIWSAVIWRAGLVSVLDLDPFEATGIAGVAGVVFWAATLL